MSVSHFKNKFFSSFPFRDKRERERERERDREIEPFFIRVGVYFAFIKAGAGKNENGVVKRDRQFFSFLFDFLLARSVFSPFSFIYIFISLFSLHSLFLSRLPPSHNEIKDSKPSKRQKK